MRVIPSEKLDEALRPFIGDAPYILVFGDVETQATRIFSTQSIPTTIALLSQAAENIDPNDEVEDVH